MSGSPDTCFEIGKKARDLLYKDYAIEPPTYFRYKLFKWNFDLSCDTPEILPGFTTRFKFVIPETGKVELRYSTDFIGAAAGVGVKAYQHGSFKGNGYNPVATFSSVIGSNSFLSVGTNAAYDISTGTFDELDTGISFNTPFLVTSFTMDKFDSVRASCYYPLNPSTRTAVGGELEHNFTSKGNTTLTVGAQHELFPVAFIKARVNTEAKIGGLIKLQFLEKLFIAVSGEVDLRHANPHMVSNSKVGFSIALRP